MSVSIRLEGIGDVDQMLRELEAEIGDKAARSKILIPSVREALLPVLSAAQAEAPMDTGGLKLSLRIDARRPTAKDRRSKYVTRTDTVIAIVTTASGKQLKKMSQAENIAKSKRKLQKLGVNSEKFAGIDSDARAIAQEFGSARNPAHPYLRPALERNAANVVNNLAEILSRRIQQFRRR